MRAPSSFRGQEEFRHDPRIRGRELGGSEVQEPKIGLKL